MFLKNKLQNISFKLIDKKIIWADKVKIYTDGGFPKFYWIPRINNHNFDKYWCLRGFVITIFGRQYFFVFGKDIKGLYGK